MLHNEADMDSETSESTSEEENLSMGEGMESSEEDELEQKSSEENQLFDEDPDENDDYEDASSLSSSQEIGTSADVPAPELVLHEMSSLTDDPNSEVTAEAWEHRARPRLWNDSVFKGKLARRHIVLSRLTRHLVAEKRHKNSTLYPQ
jgi:hypothetical protein